jgi:endonuclease-3 related protein
VKHRANGRQNPARSASRNQSPGPREALHAALNSKRGPAILLEIYRSLLDAYGPQGWWPVEGHYFPRKSPDSERRRRRQFEIILGAVLTQNTTWKNAEKALRNLREKGPLDPGKILRTRTAELSELLRPSGYHNQKALKVKRASAFAVHCFRRGRSPSREELLRVKGIGFETADSILLYAFGKPCFVVDAYTRRLCARLGLAGEKAAYAELQALFSRKLPADARLFNEYHALIVRHSKETCAKVPRCGSCVLNERSLCPYPRKRTPQRRPARGQGA